MFVVPREMVAVFYEWCKEMYGVAITVHDKPVRGEHARFMLHEGIYIVREHSDNEQGLTLDVWSSRQNDLEEMMDKFSDFLENYLKEINNEESNDE